MSGDKAKCVSDEECYETGFRLNEHGIRECTTAAKCVSEGYFLEKDMKKCVTADTCSKLDPEHYAYGATSECTATAPDEDGGFDEDEKKKGRYVCASDKVLDLVGQKRRCVTELQCIYTETGIVTDSRTCIARDEWLRENDRNVVNVFSAETLPDDGDLPPSPARVCVNRQDSSPIQDAVLFDERICVCQNALLDVRESELACIAPPTVFDESALQFVLSFPHG